MHHTNRDLPHLPLAVRQAIESGQAKLPSTGSKAIRAKCIECSGDNFGEVRRCEVLDCPLWEYRMGRYPATARAKTPHLLSREYVWLWNRETQAKEFGETLDPSYTARLADLRSEYGLASDSEADIDSEGH